MTFRIARGPLRWYLRATGFTGITLPPLGMFLLRERFNDEQLRRHEEVHWEQAQRLGVVRFYALYLWYSVRYGYRNNPLEVEARERD